jgi:hypothetical protein
MKEWQKAMKWNEISDHEPLDVFHDQVNVSQQINFKRFFEGISIVSSILQLTFCSWEQKAFF